MVINHRRRRNCHFCFSPYYVVIIANCSHSFQDCRPAAQSSQKKQFKPVRALNSNHIFKHPYKCWSRTKVFYKCWQMMERKLMHFDCFCIESNIYKSSVSRSICVYCISGFHYATCSSAQTEVITTKESHYLALICLCVKLSWDRVEASYSRMFGKTFKDISAGALNVFTKRQYYETSIVKY